MLHDDVTLGDAIVLYAQSIHEQGSQVSSRNPTVQGKGGLGALKAINGKLGAGSGL